VDYSYVECTSACIQALAKAKLRFAKKFDRQIDRAIKKGVAFIKKKQKPDGSWQGSWAVCFTYGTWFGVWGLLDGGILPDSVEIRRAAGFLLQHQNADGGWGEDPQSCIEGRYIRSSESRVVNTAWAVLALVRSGLADTAAVRRAVRYLQDRQQKNGDWPQEPLVGVFNKTSLINYENYRRYFPTWALAEFYRYSYGR
jgi:squalene cyclase